MTAANAEVSRDNVEMLFVTVFAAILDLRSGELAYCNAGHENPYLLRPGSAQVERIADGDGPPLCAMSDYDYRSACRRLAPGELLCLMTDGVTEAQNAAGALYGHARAEQVIGERFRSAASARELVTALQADVLRVRGRRRGERRSDDPRAALERAGARHGAGARRARLAGHASDLSEPGSRRAGCAARQRRRRWARPARACRGRR